MNDIMSLLESCCSDNVDDIAEVKHLFAEPKYATMEELLQIRKNAGKKRARKT